MIEPRSRTVDAELLMESLFKLTELESRIPLNMNVLVKGRIPQGARPRRSACANGSTIAARCWCAAPGIRLAEIEHRLEVLGGYLVAYLNLDKVIKIIRKEDEPKPVLMKTFKLTDVQADAILNMRLRNLRKLEEMEIRAEDKALREERTKLKALIGSTAQQWKTIAGADQGDQRHVRAEDRHSASAAPASARRPSTTRRRSKRRWWCASRSPSWCPRRAGSARCAATSATCPASRSRPTTH